MSDKYPSPYPIGCRTPVLNITPPENTILLEYVFVDQTRLYFKTKTRVVNEEPKTHKDCPEWDHMMTTHRQSEAPKQEVILRPVAMYNDPFRKGRNKFVLCECLDSKMNPIEINTRVACTKILSEVEEEEPWFGIEQEYMILDQSGHPFGWRNISDPNFKPNACNANIGVTDSAAFERQLAEVHLNACLYAGVNMFGMIREANPGQWEIQTGPTQGIDAADDVQMARYLLLRVAEMFGVQVTFEAYPVASKYCVQAIHINFSTKKMREEGGFRYIEECIRRLSKVPNKHLMKFFDRDNGQTSEGRLNGINFNPDGRKFSYAIGDKRTCSVRVTSTVARMGKGYLEERRPACDCDIYTAIGAFTKAALMEYDKTEWDSDKL